MKRSFLFLQGPHGPFFHRLGERLAALGHAVLRVNFNAGDWLDWHGGHALAFRGRPGEWPARARELALAHGVTDLVLYGDCRPVHESAISALRPLGVRVHVFEEGYFRPNWVTLEEDGVNGHTAIPRSAEGIIELAERLGWPAREGADAGPGTRAMVRRCVGHYAARWLGAGFFPHFRTHRPHNSLAEALHWLPRAAGRALGRERAEREVRQLLDGGRPFFLLALQLDSDAQIRRHSRFADMGEVIAGTLASFAAAAPAEARLVVKRHPLDSGLAGYRRLTRRLARRHGIDGRVDFLDGGHLPTLLEQASGTIVVNSTVGLQAIHHGCPTKALGTAIYDVPGLVDPAPLDGFWAAPMPPNPRLYRAFRTVVIGHSQHNGSFYTEQGMSLLLPSVAARLSGTAVSRRKAGAAPLREAVAMTGELVSLLAGMLAPAAGPSGALAGLHRTAMRICNDMVMLADATAALEPKGASLLAEACGLAAAVRRRLEACVVASGAAPETSPGDEPGGTFPGPAGELRMLLVLMERLEEELGAWADACMAETTPERAGQQAGDAVLVL
jgi:capsular polysaccharide export protein